MKYPHFDYFLTLCEDFEDLFRFIEPTQDNFPTYSIELVRLFLAVGSEIDVVAKLVCAKLKSTSRARDINDYRNEILGTYSDLPDVELRMPRNGISLLPWKDWRSGQNPAWWKLYNAVKHERNAAFRDANLGNTLNALGGLMILVGYLYGEELASSGFYFSHNFIRFHRKYYGGQSLGEEGHKHCYLLPGIPKQARK